MLIRFIYNDVSGSVEMDPASTFAKVKELIGKELDIRVDKLVLDDVELGLNQMVQESEITTESVIQVVEARDRLVDLWLIAKDLPDFAGQDFDKDLVREICFKRLKSNDLDEELDDLYLQLLSKTWYWKIEVLLYEYVKREDYYMVEKILDLGLDFDLGKKYSFRRRGPERTFDLLGYIILSDGYSDTVEKLMKYDVDALLDYDRALCASALIDDLDIAKVLVSRVSNFGKYLEDDVPDDSDEYVYRDALDFAFRNRNLEFFKFLLDSGMSPSNFIKYIPYLEDIRYLGEFALELFERGHLYECIEKCFGIKDCERLDRCLKTL